MTPVAKDVKPKQWRLNPELAALAIGIPLAVGHRTAVPYFSNQNTYLLHAVSTKHPVLASDWLATTDDPYSFFSGVAGHIYAILGDEGFRFMSVLATYLALLGVYFTARALSPVTRPVVPLVTMTFLGLTVNPIFTWVTEILGLRGANLFGGVAGQDIFSDPGIFQPSSAGSLLLLGFGIWLSKSNIAKNPQTSLVLSLVALFLVSLACMIHPIYLIVTGLAIGAAILVEFRRGLKYLLKNFGLVAFLVLVSALANPVVLSSPFSRAAEANALSRLAFERIPHHTLISDWSQWDLLYLALVLLAAWWVGPLISGKRIRYWLIILIAVSLSSAVIVEVTRWAPLALLFPWRVTILLVPLSATILVTRGGLAVAQGLSLGLSGRRAILAIAAVAVFVSGLSGYLSSMRLSSPAVADSSVALVKQIRPVGVGLVPLAAENVRLNASVPIFVDWKSHPLAGEGDLHEWWLRIDLVREFEARPEFFCTSPLINEVDWILLPSDTQVPSCLFESPVLGTDDGFQIISVAR